MKRMIRPLHVLLVFLLLLSVLNFWMYDVVRLRRKTWQNNTRLFDIVTSGLGLTDLCISTEARYTRHPAISDQVVPFMDHPGAIDHFPTGSFWAPPSMQAYHDQETLREKEVLRKQKK